MRRFFDELERLNADDGFINFQNALAQSFYDALGQGYALEENEVALVERLVDAANARSFNGTVKLLANMLHGSRSYVEFNYMDKPVTKELGDMAIISVVTSGKTRLLQKICIIQNKKYSAKHWDIDVEQLFLLKNFPPFTGNQGIFKNCRGVPFRNTSGCLGAFGLFDSPGEMIFTSAGLVTEFIRGKKSLSVSDISVLDTREYRAFTPYSFPLRRYYYEKGAAPAARYLAENFLGNFRFARGLYDFARSWTQLSIGEVTCADDTVVNASVDAFANFLIRSAGFGDISHPPGDELFVEENFSNQMAVFILHMDIEPEKKS